MAKEKGSSDTDETTNNKWLEPSAAQIADWKKKHECENIAVFTAIDPRDKEKKKAYFREPKIVDIQRATQSEKAKAGTFNQSIFENCWLDGHPDIKLYDPLTQGMLANIGELNTAAEVTIAKL